MAVVAGLVVLLLAATGPSADAGALRCGDVVTRNVTLQEDLVCGEGFAGAALTIGADDVRLDLGGHSIIAPSGLAVRSDGYNNITIQNGSIGDWQNIGAEITGAEDVTIRDMTQLRPVIVRDSHNVVIENNAIIGDHRLRNAVHFERTHNSVVRANGISISSDRGVRVVNSRGNRIEGNHVSASGGGISVAGARNVVLDNSITADGQPGVVVRGDRNVLRGNFVSGSQNHGIWVTAQAWNTLVDENEALSNEADGIRILSRSTVVRNNMVHRNGEWGIWAVSGVRDGGGNSAEDNGVADCHNVVCN